MAVLLCLCGIFSFSRENALPTSNGKDTQAEQEGFSLQKARYLLGLCTKINYPRKLETALLSKEFSDYEYFEHKQNMGYKSGIAFSVANKKTESDTEIILIFRGSTGAEWYSNFHMGEGETHAGFSAATDYAYAEFSEYLEEHGIKFDNTKITLTGHSRGGAVANLLSKRLIDSGNFESVSAYTFACPNTTKSTEVNAPRYKCIYNIENCEDFITRVPLEAWDYSKFGLRLRLPDLDDENYSELYAQMEKNFEKIAGYPHISYENRSRDIEAFLKDAESIAPTVEELYSRKITTPQGSLTLGEYLENASAILSKEFPLPEGMFILASSECAELYPLTDFMLEGIDLTDLDEGIKLENSAVNSAHTLETYMAWLRVLEEEFFISRISEVT